MAGDIFIDKTSQDPSKVYNKNKTAYIGRLREQLRYLATLDTKECREQYGVRKRE